MIRNKRFGHHGFAPAGDLAALPQMGVQLPDVMWDGANMYSSGGTPRVENVRVVMEGNRAEDGGIGTFLSLGIPVAGSPLTEAAPDPSYPPIVRLAEPPEIRMHQHHSDPPKTLVIVNCRRRARGFAAHLRDETAFGIVR